MISLARPFFLIASISLWLSGCTDAMGRFCVFFCTDTTSIQRDYIELRDTCRELAELKTHTMTPRDVEGTKEADKSQKIQLVGTFSECMNNQSWAVPGPATNKNATTPTPEAPRALTQAQKDPAIRRAAECAFARQAASSSIIAKKRAEACDLECTHARQLSPDAPPHPSCSTN